MPRPEETSPEQLAEQRDRVLAEFREARRLDKENREKQLAQKKEELIKQAPRDKNKLEQNIRADLRGAVEGGRVKATETVSVFSKQTKGEPSKPEKETLRIHNAKYIPNEAYSERRQELERSIFEKQRPVWKKYHEDKKNTSWTEVQKELKEVRDDEKRKLTKKFHAETDLKLRLFRDKILREKKGIEKEKAGKMIKDFIDAENQKFYEDLGERAPLTDEQKLERLLNQLKNGSFQVPALEYNPPQQSKIEKKKAEAEAKSAISSSAPIAIKNEKFEEELDKKRRFENKRDDEIKNFDYAKHIEEEKQGLEEKRKEYIAALDKFTKEKEEGRGLMNKLGGFFVRQAEDLGIKTKSNDEKNLPPNLLKLQRSYQSATKAYANAKTLGAFKELKKEGIVDTKDQNRQFDARYKKTIIEETVFNERKIKFEMRQSNLPSSEKSRWKETLEKSLGIYTKISPGKKRILTFILLTGTSFAGGLGIGSAAAYGVWRVGRSMFNAWFAREAGKGVDKKLSAVIEERKGRRLQNLEKEFSIFSLERASEDYEKVLGKEVGDTRLKNAIKTLFMLDAAAIAGNLEAHGAESFGVLHHNNIPEKVHGSKSHPSPRPRHIEKPEIKINHPAAPNITPKVEVNPTAAPTPHQSIAEPTPASTPEALHPAPETSHPDTGAHVDQKPEAIPQPEKPTTPIVPKVETLKPEPATYSENIRDIHHHGRIIEGNSEQVLKHYYIKNAEKFGYDPNHKKVVEAWAGREANRMMHTHRHWNAPVRAHDKVTFTFDQNGNPVERIVERHGHAVSDVKSSVVTETHHHEQAAHQEEKSWHKTKAAPFKEPDLPAKDDAALSNTGLSDQGLFNHDVNRLDNAAGTATSALENTAQINSLTNTEVTRILTPIFGDGFISNLKNHWTEGLAKTSAENIIKMKGSAVDARMLGVTPQELLKTKKLIAELIRQSPIQKDELTGDYLMRITRTRVLESLPKQN